MKRRRNIPAKPGQLKAYYGRENRYSRDEVLYMWGGSGASKPDTRILMTAFEENKVYGGKTLIEELEERGYDLTTLTFSIQMKKDAE